MMNKRKYDSITCIVSVIVIFAICLFLSGKVMSSVPEKEYVQETMVQYPVSYSDFIEPGDYYEQRFISTRDTVDSVGVAINYDEKDLAGKIRIEISDEDGMLIEREFSFSDMTSDVFTYLDLNLENAKGKEILIRFANVSDGDDRFRLPVVTDKDLYLTGAGEAFLTVRYFTGYYIYTAVCYVFWILASGLILSVVILKVVKRKVIAG